MPSKKLLIFVGVLALLAGILARLPASLITDRINVNGASIEGVRGTVWNGAIESLVVNGEPVAPIAWKLHPSAFLRGKAKADVTVLPRDSRISGTVEASLGGAMLISGVEIDGQLRSIASGTSLGPVAGSVAGTIAEVTIVDLWPESVIGQLTIGDLRYPANAPYTLGNYAIDCPGGNPPIRCDVKDAGGPIELAGEITLSADKTYQLATRLRARPGAPDEIRQGLTFLGRPDAAGFVQFDFSGALQTR